MSRDDTYLVDILESAKMALSYVSDKSWDEFYEDTQFRRERAIDIHKSPGVK